jgi:hypothetical protein
MHPGFTVRRFLVFIGVGAIAVAAPKSPGGRGGDLIKGGTGHDRANGGPGWDTCVNIEVRTSCEVVS